MEEIKDIERYLMDTIVEMPHVFTAGEERFALYPVTLGKMLIMQPIVEDLGISAERLAAGVQVEALRLAREQRRGCLRLIALHTLREKDEIRDPAVLERRTDTLDKIVSEEDVAVLMVIILTSDRLDQLMRHLGIDREQADMKKVMDVKNSTDKNNYTFGGRSLYGSFIAPLMDMGFSWDEILWERSYTNLRLMLSDKANSIFVSDDERKKINITRDRERVNGDDRDAVLMAIRSQPWD